jgi:hypothetical protein
MLQKKIPGLAQLVCSPKVSYLLPKVSYLLPKVSYLLPKVSYLLYKFNIFKKGEEAAKYSQNKNLPVHTALAKQLGLVQRFSTDFGTSLH